MIENVLTCVLKIMIKIDKQDNLIDMTSVQWLILYILCEFYALDYFGIRFWRAP